MSIPLFRLEDTGMGQQMQEYAVSQVLYWFRRFDDYQALKQQARWQPLEDYRREEFTNRDNGRGRAWFESGGSASGMGISAAELEP
ncbi:Glyoxylate/hydroxypyruvate reductase A [Raoultella ornithinolytica]|nr:Glyoxylate/hydroxypyruvate reductase A [Raoultella ornithinolytica]